MRCSLINIQPQRHGLIDTVKKVTGWFHYKDRLRNREEQLEC